MLLLPGHSERGPAASQGKAGSPILPELLSCRTTEHRAQCYSPNPERWPPDSGLLCPSHCRGTPSSAVAAALPANFFLTLPLQAEAMDSERGWTREGVRPYVHHSLEQPATPYPFLRPNPR